MKNTVIVLFCAFLFFSYKAVKFNKEIEEQKALIKPLELEIEALKDTIKYLRVYPAIMYKMDAIINKNKSSRNLKHKDKDLQELLLKTM